MVVALNRRSLSLAIASLALTRGAQASEPDGQAVPIELFDEARALGAAVPVGSARGDVTLIEFFDYNCPYCRRSAQDIPALLAGDPDLDYLLVNFAVLGPASVQATRVALGYAQMYGPKGYLAFHLALFGVRGGTDGPAALEVAERLGGERKRLAAAADSARTTERMKGALRVGSSLGLSATPAFVIGSVGPAAYVGALGRKRALVAEARA
jgi:protein-disulfide isomerase